MAVGYGFYYGNIPNTTRHIRGKMAGLKKPIDCKCGSLQVHREYHPERWVCDKCDNVITSRKKKAQTGICNKCSVVKSDNVSFKSGKNQCIDCYNKYMCEWNELNRDDQRSKKRIYYKNNREKIRTRSNAYWQGSWDSYLSDIWRRTKRTAEKRIDGKERNLDFEISKQDLFKLVEKQGYKCAITNIPMNHEWSKMTSASVDRIDSSKGYVLDNVQLVCKSINLLKHTHTNEEVFEFLRKVI